MRPITHLESPPRGTGGPGAAGIYLRPLDLAHGSVRPDPADRLLGGGPSRFNRVEVVVRMHERVVAFAGLLDELRDWAGLEGLGQQFDAAVLGLTRRRQPLFGRSWDRPLVMGVVNVSPDSFYDGSVRRTVKSAISHAHALIAAGADMLDVGGESTRPGAGRVGWPEEVDRVVPVIEASVGFGVPISIDTSKSPVMRAAFAAGASIINDVTALTGDPESLGFASKAGAPVILMHMQGTPRTMQDSPSYDCAPLDVADYLALRIAACERAGVPAGSLLVDPGIGFGKTVDHNAALLARIGILHSLGAPVLLGVSRKSVIAHMSRGEDPEDRLGGSLALALAAVEQGVQVLRVHDVAETCQALAVRQAVLDAG